MSETDEISKRDCAWGCSRKLHLRNQLHSKIINYDGIDFFVESDGECPTCRSKFERKDGQTDSKKWHVWVFVRDVSGVTWPSCKGLRAIRNTLDQLASRARLEANFETWWTIFKRFFFVWKHVENELKFIFSLSLSTSTRVFFETKNSCAGAEGELKD